MSDKFRYVIGPLYSLLCRHKSPAADEILVEACRHGDPDEVAAAAEALLHRKNAKGLADLLSLFPELPPPVADRLLEEGAGLASAASRAARGETLAGRIAAARFIGAAGRSELVYVLGDLLRSNHPETFAAACDAVALLANRCDTVRRSLRTADPDVDQPALYDLLLSLRAKLLPVVARALDAPRGAEGPELADAAVILLEEASGPLYEAFKRHGGRAWPLVFNRLRRPATHPAVTAVLRGACRGGLRQELPGIFACTDRPEPLLALRESAYLLIDPNLHLAMTTATEGTWLTPRGLREQLDTLARVDADSAPAPTARDPDLYAAEVLGIARWVLASGVGGALRDELFEILFRTAAEPSLAIALLREAAMRDGGLSTRMAQLAWNHADERVARMAARHLSRQRGAEANGELLRRLAGAAASVRPVIARRIARRSFESLWARYDAMPVPQRTKALTAMCKLLDETVTHLRNRLLAGPAPVRLRALAMVGEAQLAPIVREAIFECCRFEEARVRSKAVLLLQHIACESTDERLDTLLDDALVDADPRVRANAIEVLERTGRRELRPLLEARGRLGRNRERANAIKALDTLGLADSRDGLFDMLRDTREAHRLSAVWAVEETGQWKLLDEVVRLARTDTSLKVRRNALSSVRRIAGNMRSPRDGSAGAAPANHIVRPAA